MNDTDVEQSRADTLLIMEALLPLVAINSKEYVRLHKRLQELRKVKEPEADQYLCVMCGVGYYLPSGVCDHCNQLKPAPTTEPSARPATMKINIKGKKPDPSLPSALWDHLEWTWTIIANANGGDWNKEPEQWQLAASKWRDEYYKLMNQRIKKRMK